MTSRQALPSTVPCGDGGIYPRADAFALWAEATGALVLDWPDCPDEVPLNRPPTVLVDAITAVQNGPVVSTVLEIPFEAVRDMLDEDPALLWNAARMLARRLRAMDEVLADSVFLDVTGRTAKKLIELSGGRDEFVLPVTQEELAGMVGASRERVNKAIASFARLGWLEQHERNYRIIERDRLENRAR